MAEKSDSFCEQDIEERLKKLDAQIKMPDIPDAQSIFDRAENEKRRRGSLRGVRYIAAAAAVVLICVSIPLVTAVAKKSFVSSDSSSGNGSEAYCEDCAPQSPYIERNTAVEEEAEGYSYTGDASAKDRSQSPEEASTIFAEDQAAQIEAALEEYFYIADIDGINSSKSANGWTTADSFTDSVSKKRSVDVEVSDDSVSIMVYDTSGASEILSAFWVEGIFQSSSSEGDYYLVNVSKQITYDEFEGGDYMPCVGDAQKGIYTLSAENVYVSEKLTKAVLNMSIEINIEDGTYEIYASLE